MLMRMSAKREHPNDPLHGVTLETMLNDLVDFYGWRELGMRIGNVHDCNVARCLKIKKIVLR